ncbi:DNA mismatch endonuclease Vsr [Marinobacter sp.]|uniref:very short patch repair endonuclease n=1 Tax=Marinobacter sp. TaxID=50741 RepID=UPI0023538868|nr:DNA mismatch endonuclease Vsr [Marinobacter sp.]
MTDTVNKQTRSKIMSSVKTKDTGPEMVVRRLLHRSGYRYRLHAKDLPGRPDLVFRSRKKVIFVHGCFWHGHEKCRFGNPPKSRLDYWLPKLQANRARDERTIRSLREQGWDVMIVWQCEVKETADLLERLVNFLEGHKHDESPAGPAAID